MKFQSSLLLVAIDYHAMFKNLLAKVPYFKGEVNTEIAWAKEHLHKNDRIVWYLRWIRVSLISDTEIFNRSMGNRPGVPEGSTEKELKAMSAKSGKTYTKDNIISDLPRFKRDLQHYMGTD